MLHASTQPSTRFEHIQPRTHTHTFSSYLQLYNAYETATVTTKPTTMIAHDDDDDDIVGLFREQHASVYTTHTFNELLTVGHSAKRIHKTEDKKEGKIDREHDEYVKKKVKKSAALDFFFIHSLAAVDLFMRNF